MNENNLFQVLREDRELHLKSATAQHLNLFKEQLTKTTGDLNGLQEEVNDLKKKNEERCEALQNKVHAVEGQLDKEVQILKVELQNLDATSEEKMNDLRKEFEKEAGALSKKIEGRVHIIQKEDKERCEALRRQHDEEVRGLKEESEKKVDALQKKLAACEKKIGTLENVVNTNRNERAANEKEANNQTRQLEERVRNITEELDRVNRNATVSIIASAFGLGGVIIFAIVRILV